MGTNAWFSLGFTDQLGGHYSTRPIYIDTSSMSAEENAASIQDALEALPNFAIPQVEVDFTNSSGFDVTFVHGSNSGKQPLLQFSGDASCDSGSQPLFVSGNYTCSVSRSAADDEDYKEQAVCSNRGTCDSS